MVFSSERLRGSEGFNVCFRSNIVQHRAAAGGFDPIEYIPFEITKTLPTPSLLQILIAALQLIPEIY